MQDQSAPRELENSKHKNLLTGIIFDENNSPYTPVFTVKKNKRYRYYLNEFLNNNKSHPNHVIARLPAHEIEAVIETNVRRNILKLIATESDELQSYIQENQTQIPTYKLIRNTVQSIIVMRDSLHITLKPSNPEKIIKEYLDLNIKHVSKNIGLTIPYQTKRAKNGAVLIETEYRKGFDSLSKSDLKRIVQGHVWREEHFEGTYIQTIAERENCSSRYVRKVIMASLDI